MRVLAALFAILALRASPAAADSSEPASFGSVQNTPIIWEPPPANVELTSGALRFTHEGTQARSQPLPLKPQHYYRIQT
ncbi:MAG TPA: hypothetical protein VFN67_07555, partial [Polyangiales bacterium]|nr:hypothetical protein [Polyangiales bacterium]